MTATLPTLHDLQAALDEATVHEPEYFPACDLDLSPWYVSVSVIFTDGNGNRDQCCLEDPKGGDRWWRETWDGTIEQVERLLAEAREPAAAFISTPQQALAGNLIPGGGMGYLVLTLEREWSRPRWSEDAATVAVYPALVEQDREGGESLEVYRNWMGALDAAVASAGGA